MTKKDTPSIPISSVLLLFLALSKIHVYCHKVKVFTLISQNTFFFFFCKQDDIKRHASSFKVKNALLRPLYSYIFVNSLVFSNQYIYFGMEEVFKIRQNSLMRVTAVLGSYSIINTCII
jgi:hypothetical protein